MKPQIKKASAVVVLACAASVQVLVRPRLEFPQDADEAFNAAVEDMQRGNLVGALAALETAVKIHPDDSAIQELLGQVLDKLGRKEEALPHLRKATALSPQQQAFWNNLAIVCLRVSKIDEAENALQKSLGIGPSAIALRLLGMIRFHQYRTREGLSYFERSLATSPDDVRSWYYAASAHHLLGETDLALRDYQRALKRVPNDFHNRLGLARLLQELGMHREAIDSLHVARNVDPKNAEVYELLSRSYLKTGDLQSALESARRATRLNPNNAASHYQLGTVLTRAGRDAEASAEFGLFRRLGNQGNKAKKGAWTLDESSSLSFDMH